MSFAKNLYNKYGKQLLDAGLDVLKTHSRKVVHKAVEITGKFIGYKIADKIVKPVEEIIFLIENTKEILHELQQIL